MKDTIYRADAIEAVENNSYGMGSRASVKAIKALPSAELANLKQEFESADAVSRDDYNETDGVIKIEKQSAMDVEEIKYIIIRSPNYTRYFYNESMPTSAEAVHGWIPCSERLPNVGEDVLFCDAKWTEEGCLRADGDWWQFRWSTVMPKEKVIAWMPLPNPYKGGDVE